jgi:hypothetical protein
MVILVEVGVEDRPFEVTPMVISVVAEVVVEDRPFEVTPMVTLVVVEVLVEDRPFEVTPMVTLVVVEVLVEDRPFEVTPMVTLVVVEEEDLKGTACFRDEAHPISQVDHPIVPTFRPVSRRRVREIPFVVQKTSRVVHRTTIFPTGHRGMHFVSTELPEVVVGPD